MNAADVEPETLNPKRYERYFERKLLDRIDGMKEIHDKHDREQAEMTAKRNAPKPGQLSKIGAGGKTLLLFSMYNSGGKCFFWAYDFDDARRLAGENLLASAPYPFFECEQPPYAVVEWSRE